MIKLSQIAYPAIALLSLAAAGAAFADDITPDNTASQVFSTTKTRTQVQAELFAARANGSIQVWSTSYNPLTVAKSEKSRAEVVAEVRANRGANFDATWYGEDSGSFAILRTQPVRQAAATYAGLPMKASQAQ
jgi:hypothetical protein